jgi:hypothetical protein
VYANVLPHALHGISKEAKEIHVNWQTGMVACYADKEDAMNHVPFWETQVHVTAARVRSRDEYVCETFAFLQRGHSMLEYECQCAHGLSGERAAELGVFADPQGAARSRVCLVERKRERRSFDEIARELHVQDIEGYLEAEKMTLLHALTALAGMRISQQCCSSSSIVTRYLHSPACCIEPVLSTANDLVHGAQIMSPWPFSVKNDERMQRLLPFLKKKADAIICMLRGDEWQIYDKKATTQKETDADIRELWNIHGVDSTMQRPPVLERALKAVGLQPQPMRPAPPPPAKAPKKRNLETNGKKRRQQHYHDLLTRRLK